MRSHPSAETVRTSSSEKGCGLLGSEHQFMTNLPFTVQAACSVRKTGRILLRRQSILRRITARRCAVVIPWLPSRRSTLPVQGLRHSERCQTTHSTRPCSTASAAPLPS
jgi:hypothetical protein